MPPSIFFEAEREAAPVCILGTTEACAAIFARMGEGDETIALSAGSRLMDTGGAKGQAVPLTSAQVVAFAEQRLGIEADFVVNEYGMTELCSQLYDATGLNSDLTAGPGERLKIAPPWMRPGAIDPVTMRRLPDGSVGMLGFIDLANVCSVAAVLTEDLGVVEGNRVRVLGRATAGGVRGCALSVAEFEATARRTQPTQ